MGNRKKLLQFLRPDPAVAAAKSPSESDDDDDHSSSSPPPPTTPSTATASPYAMSPWKQLPGLVAADADPLLQSTATGLLGSLVKEDGGHVYSLAASGVLLYTGTDSRNVRVWRDRRELGGFRAGSGLVKAIVVAASDGRIYTGHQDGKLRVWRRRLEEDRDGAADDRVRHRRVGSLPRARDAAVASSLSLLLRSSGRRRAEVKAGHADAVSCLSLDAAAGLLYSGSWDRAVKVWRLADSRCLETLLRAHDDAVNAVAAAGFDALLFTGAADGTVKVWRRETLTTTDGRNKKKNKGHRTRHVLERVLRRPAGKDGGGAVTAIAVAPEARVVYVGSSDGLVSHYQFPRPGCYGSDGGVREGGALRGHRMAVLCVAVSGRVVASGSADRTISVWRREEGKAGHARVAVLAGHTGPVKCLAVDAEEEEEGRWVVYSGSLDGSVKVWRVSAADGVMTSPAQLRLWKGTMSPLPTPTPAARASWAPEPTKRMNGEWRARV